MLIALILVPLASFLWGITNYIDKYLVSKISRNGDCKGLIVFSSLVAGIIMAPVFLVVNNFSIDINIKYFLLILLSSTFVLLSTSLYLKALSKSETSIVIAMFQLLPVFGYLWGLIFLNQVLTANQIIGGIIVIISSVATTYEINNNKFSKERLFALLLMIGASIASSIYFLLFNLSTKRIDFNVVVFWYQICLLINGILLIIFSKKHRISFLALIKSNGKKVAGYNILNEIINSIANMLVNFATTIAPLAIVLTMNGLQPFFVFLIGLIGAIIFPNAFDENNSTKNVIQKIVCIVIGIVGLTILYL